MGLRTCTFTLAILLSGLYAGCAEPAGQSGTTPRRQPAERPRPKTSPLKLSDMVVLHLKRINSALNTFDETTYRLSHNPTVRRKLGDALAPLDLIVSVHNTNLEAARGLPPATTPTGRQLVWQYRAYNRLLTVQLMAYRQAMGAVHMGSGTPEQRWKVFRETVNRLSSAESDAKATLYEKACTHVKAHGVREGEARFHPCLMDDRLWVTRAVKIKSTACACRDTACVKQQQQALNDYIEETKGIQIRQAAAKKAAKAVLKAQTCISHKLVEEKLKQLKRNP